MNPQPIYLAPAATPGYDRALITGDAMSRTILATIALITSVSPAFTAPPSDEVMDKVTAAIRKH